MKQLLKRGLALLLALTISVGLLSGLTVSAATVNYVTGKPTGSSYTNVIKNWGKRGVTATFLSPKAESFYQRNDVSFAELASLSGASSVSNVPSSPLYLQLQDLMKSNHHTYTSYGDVRYLMSYTDIQENGTGSTGNKISAIYSAVNVGPTWDYGDTWNREHVWPNSKGLGGSDEDDIMMLRPENPSVNTSRSNTAFGVSGNYQEPNGNAAYNVRGDIARILLYTYVRWGNTAKMWGSSGVIESKQVLLDWLEEDPVDTWEMGRNDSVESITGTRNVFVDYPELAYVMLGEAVPEDMVTPSCGEYVDTYTITAKSGQSSYGTVRLQGNVITAVPADGYTVADYTVTSGSARVIPSGDTFTVYPSSNCTVVINFRKLEQYTLTFTGGDGKTAAPSVTKTEGSTVTLPRYQGTADSTHTFEGWIDRRVSDTTYSPLALYAGWSYVVKGNVNFYALYSHQVGSKTYYTTDTCNHRLTVTGAKEATCMASGYTGDSRCSICGTTIPGTTIPKLPHNYVGGVCTYGCGTIQTGNTIAEAKAYTSESEVYTLTGIVTYINGRTVYMEDATGGICVYFAKNATPASLALGDELRVTDTMTVYNGLIETSSTTTDQVEILSKGNDLPIRELTLEQILADNNNEYLSRRVTVGGLTMGPINTSGATTLTDAKGNTITLFKATGMSSDINQGDEVIMTCIVSTYNGYQLILNPGTAATDVVEQVIDTDPLPEPEPEPDLDALKNTQPVLTAESEPVTGGGILTWEAVEGATCYKVYRATGKSGSYKCIETVEETRLQVKVSAGSTRYYKIKAVYDDGETEVISKYSNYVKVIGKCAQPVVSRIYVRASNGKPYIDWDKVSGAKKYYVYRVDEDGTMTRLASTTNSYYTHTKAVVGETYTYVVRAIASSSSRNSIYSEPVSCLTACARPELDVDIKSASGKPELEWDAVKGAVSYDIYRTNEDGNYEKIANTTECQWLDLTALVDTRYGYTVVAVAENENCNSAVSNAEFGTVKCAKPVASIELVENKPMVRWNEVEGAVKYYVYRSTSKSSGYKKIATVEEGESYHDTKAKKNKTYYYKIVAVSEDSKSSYSSYVKIKSK